MGPTHSIPAGSLTVDSRALQTFVDRLWDDAILPALADYVRIPNKSPAFDAQWQAHGFMDQAVALAAAWCQAQAPAGATVEVRRLPGRTPLLCVDVPATDPARTDTVVLYGHLDKQPEFTGWREGLGPWQPVRREERLYGRGAADDGYAVFASLAALRALEAQSVPHARCLIIAECCEESGSYDLPHYIDELGDAMGEVSLVVCLDAECGNYEQLWCTSSLRGNLTGVLEVAVMREGVHSGAAGGIVPDSFRLLRQLMERIESGESGELRPQALHAAIPEERRRQMREAAAALGESVYAKFPFVEGAGPGERDPAELIARNTWGPALAVTGANGLPAVADAGNVLRPATRVKLSFRLPPTLDPAPAAEAVKRALETDPPNGAHVRFRVEGTMAGWNAPAVAPWLAHAMQAASRAHFGKPALYMGTGGSIPFMGFLARRFPRAQFLVSGVLGPHSNAHGPNEFLHIPTAKHVTACVAEVVAAHARRAP